MRKAAENIKWLSSSLVVVVLLLVFWVWPAWNSGSQTWYWGNDGNGDKGTSEMFRNRHAPSGHNDPFLLEGGEGSSFSQSFMADEPANQMLAFDNSPWQYHIEWYFSDSMVPESRNGATMADLAYSLSIGRWSNMNMMLTWTPFFEAMGTSMRNSAFPDSLVVIDGSAMIMSMMSQMPFFTQDILGAMVMFTNLTGDQITIPLAQTCYITSPVSDPGYPGALPPIPTVSQWGMLLLAVLVAFLSFTVIRRKTRTDKS